MDRKRVSAVFIITAVLLILLICIGIMSGSISIPAGDVIALVNGLDIDTMHRNIILSIRLPRVISAVVLGGTLALSGYLLQVFFSNPIVGPFVLGISSGAKLTVACALIYVLAHSMVMNSFIMVCAAFVGAMAAMAIVLLISVRVRNMSILVVCGIMIGYICSAVTDLMVTFADDSNIVNLHNWSMGSLSGMNWSEVLIMSIITFGCLILTFLISKPIGAYRLGEAYARNMGVNITAFRVALILLSGMLAACVTAFAGPISFVGIAVPHLMKSFAKTSSPRVMIPLNFLGGAAVTLMCDTIARNIFAPAEVSISSVTAVFLVPVVIYMMIKRRSDK